MLLASVESSDQLTGRDDGLTACKSVTGGQAASAQSQDRGQDKLKMLPGPGSDHLHLVEQIRDSHRGREDRFSLRHFSTNVYPP